MRIVSGIQSTGAKHLGNYLGAIRHYVDMQHEGEALYFVVDLHALTTLPDPAALREATLDTAALLIAAGLDTEQSLLFVQSQLGAEHCQLTWFLMCVAGYGELTRMTQFKDKTAGKQSFGAGIFTYPVLMAADILAYDAVQVPVGSDQKQHIELARNLAERFNSRYGETFVLPQPRIATVAARVMDLQDPTHKMSTTGGSAKGTVLVLDDPDTIVRKFKSAVTDSGNSIVASPDKPGVSNLLQILSVTTGRSIDDLSNEYDGGGYGPFKLAVAEAVIEYLRPVRERYAAVRADHAELDRALARGASGAREIAAAKVGQVAQRMGLPLPATAPVADPHR